MAGDFNGDDALNLLLGVPGVGFLRQTPISMLLNSGNSTFRNSGETQVGGASLWLAVADINNEGKLDVAASSSVDGYFTAVFLEKGNGTFQPPVYANAPVSFLAAGDFYRDGNRIWSSPTEASQSRSATAPALFNRELYGWIETECGCDRPSCSVRCSIRWATCFFVSASSPSFLIHSGVTV